MCGFLEVGFSWILQQRTQFLSVVEIEQCTRARLTSLSFFFLMFKHIAHPHFVSALPFPEQVYVFGKCFPKSFISLIPALKSLYDHLTPDKKKILMLHRTNNAAMSHKEMGTIDVILRGNIKACFPIHAPSLFARKLKQREIVKQISIGFKLAYTASISNY